MVNECLGSCSAEEYQGCQDEFQLCMVALSAHNGTCECLGRFKKCSVDAGCDQMSRDAIAGLCSLSECTDSQCQLAYPRATQCDWDTHSECEIDLQQCLDRPNATIVKLYPYNVGVLGLQRWYGDPYHIEQRKHAERCRCYHNIQEAFTQLPAETCGTPVEVGRFEPQENITRTVYVNNLTYVETLAMPPVFIAAHYRSKACMSSCATSSARSSREALIAYDCAVCGDGSFMPGREECDDGNLDDFDGCDQECKIEPPDATPSRTISSEPSPLPGSVWLIWNHTVKTLHAARHNLPHKVVHYQIVVQRSYCADCEIATYTFEVPYDDCEEAESSHCSFLIPYLDGGEFLNVSLGAVNVAGMSDYSSHAIRWMILPTGDVQLEEIENQDAIQLLWYAPSDTGYGNSIDLPILKYLLEVSSCDGFPEDDPLCSTWSDVVGPEHPSIQTRDFVGGTFVYPILFNIDYDLHPGFFYIYRVTPYNTIGPAVLLEELREQFGSLPYEAPLVQFPIVYPIPIAVTSDGIQIWQGDSVASSVDSTMLQVIGFPLVRDLSDLVMTYSTDDATNPLSDVSMASSLSISSSSLEQGTTFIFRPPALPESTISSCGLCLFNVNIRFLRWTAKSISISIKFFTYPKASVMGVNPYNGPVSGGTFVKLRLQDYEGPRTRAGAGLPTIYGAYFDKLPIRISFSVAENSLFVQDFYADNITLGLLEPDSSRSYELEVLLPESPTGSPTLSNIQILVSNEVLSFNTDLADFSFEYIGAKIMALVPASAYLNPGSGGASVQLKVANLAAGSSPEVTVSGAPCAITGISDPVPNDLGTVTTVTVSVPELPFELAGTVNVSLADASLPEELKATYRYELPPTPVINADSMVIAENEGLWAPASAKGYDGSFVIQNLSPKYGVFYDEIQIYFGSKRAFVKSYLQLGLNSKVTFTTPDRMAPGMVPVNVTVLSKGIVVSSADTYEDSTPFVIEFRDLSEPRILGLSPTEGPSRGENILMVAMLSFPQLLESSASEAQARSPDQSKQMKVLGIISVKDWVDQGTAYLSLISHPTISSFQVGINDAAQAQMDALVAKTVSAIEQESFDPVVGMQQAGFAFLQMPEFNMDGLNSSSMALDIQLKAQNITVTSSYVCIAPPTGVADVSVSTETGELKIGLDGDVRLTVSLFNFAIVYKAVDITAMLGKTPLQISRLLYSTQRETKLYIIAPPGPPGVLKISLRPTHLTSNSAEFNVEYVDLRVPEVTSFGPSLVYETGGVKMEAVVALLPDVKLEDLTVDFFSIGTTSTSKIGDSVKPSKLVRQGGVPPEDTSYLTFTIPTAAVGKAKFVIGAASKASTCPETKPDCQSFSYAAVPTTAPNIVKVSPTIASSLGGTIMSISLTNFKLVTDESDIRVHFKVGTLCSQNQSMPHCFQAEQQISTDSGMRVVSNILGTRISFTAPAVPDHIGGQNGEVKIWSLQNPLLYALVPVFFRDDSIAEVVYVYPASLKASANGEIVEVLVSRLGGLQDASQIRVFMGYESSCETWSDREGKGSGCILTNGADSADSLKYNNTITEIRSGTGGLVVKFAATNRQQIVGDVRVTIANCPSSLIGKDACRKKSATFVLNFRHPQAPFIEFVDPLVVATDGRVPVKIYIDNLPASVTKNHVLVGFPSNATITDVQTLEATGYEGLNRALITALVPSSDSARSVIPKLRIPRVGIHLNFPSAISYKTPPNPVLLSFNPSTAPLLTASPIRLLIQNFPGISSASDVVVAFKWPNANPVEATVTSYSQVDSSKFATAVQDYLIDVDSPTGSQVKEGAVSMSVYHVGYRKRQGQKQGFKFIDTTLPQVETMRTDASTNGPDVVQVRMSAPTEVTLSVQNAREAIVGIQVDGKPKDLVLSQYAPESRSAKAVFSSSSRSSPDGVYGFVLFASSCGKTCTSACCETSSCSDVCTCRTSCFKLQYFDDLAPRVSFVSGTIGTEMGGSVVSVQITNFPVVEASEEASKEVAAVFDSANEGRVFVASSSAAETKLLVESPEIDLKGEFTRTVVLQLSPNSNPSQKININYVVEEAVPVLSGAVLPSKGSNKGGVRTLVRIQYFPFPTDVIVEFGSIIVPDSSISVAKTSTKQLSTISFETPATEPGDFTVRVTPKVCPNCGKSVEFLFTQLDSSLPVVLPPLPTGGPYQEVAGATQAIRVAPFPSLGYEALVISCEGKGTVKVGQIAIISVAQTDETASIVFSRPHANKVGDSVCTLTVTSAGKVRSGTFNYKFYDGTSVRLVRSDPPQLPTRLSVYGRTLDLTRSVKVTFANLKQGLTPERLSIMLGASTVVTVTSIVDVVSCSKTAIDCNRTEVTIVSQPQDVARNVPFSMTADTDDSFPLTIPYFKPCDYEKFCNDKRMLMDAQSLSTELPTDEFCNLKFCVDPSALPKPILSSMLPREGPATGGTRVQIYFQNIPAFTPKDVTVVVGSGGSAVYAKVITVSNPGGNLLSSKGMLEFDSPSIANTGSVTQLPIQFVVYVGSVAVSIGDQFIFTPVPIGRAVLTMMRPASIFSEADNTVTVQLTNFPLIKNLAELQNVKVLFEGDTIVASSIIASTYEYTLASFVLRGAAPGARPLQVYYSPHGEARATDSTITVDPPVTPEIATDAKGNGGFFPPRGIVGRDLSLSISVRYMLPELGDGDFKVSITAGGQSGELPVGEVVVQTPGDCAFRVCAQLTIPVVISKNLIPDPGGLIAMRIEASNQASDRVDFQFPYDPSWTPVLEAIDPKSVSVAKLADTSLTVYVSNVDSSFCSIGSSCVASFTFGAGSQAITRTGVVTGGSAENGLRTIFLKPPFAPKGQGGKVTLQVKEGTVAVASELDFAVPAAELVPIDAPCNGGAIVTISAMGWGKVVKLASQITVTVGGKTAKVGKILSSMSNDDTSLTTFTISTPVLTQGTRIPGTVSFELYSNTFDFECFENPVAAVEPTQASIQGQTTSADGRSITISMRNFPPLKSVSDVEVVFGSIICGGVECSILDFENGAESVELTVTVPAVQRAMEVILMVDYVGNAIPPEGGDPSAVFVRSRKFVTSRFKYSIAPPVVLSALSCEKCNSGPNVTACLVFGACADGVMPRENVLGISGASVLTVVVDNVGNIPYIPSTGQIVETAAVSVQFGNYPGLLKRVLFTDDTRSAFEIVLDSPADPGEVGASLTVQKDITRPTVSVARFNVKLYDENIQLTCSRSTGCNGQVEATKALIATVSNLVVGEGPVSETYSFFFAGLPSQDVQLVRTGAFGATFRVLPPAYTCSSCTTAEGKAMVDLIVAYKSSRLSIAETKYLYWAAPQIASLAFDSTGGKLLMTFDQETNQAKMTGAQTDCSLLFDEKCRSLLGIRSQCVWQSGLTLEIFLGAEATAVPGSLLYISASAGLTSLNGISASSTSRALCALPLIRVPPRVEIKCPETIDPCASLEIRATAFSPRPPTFIWSCSNDQTLDSFLSTQGGEALYLPPGTADMTTLSKTYQISVQVRDFMGSVSEKAVAKILKKDSATPQIRFNPPTMLATKDQEVMIKGEAVFSTCPVAKEDLAFSWRQVSGPALPAELLATQLPQLQIPSGTLKEGSVYQLALKLGMTSDSSKSSESVFVLTVGYQGLEAIIEGGISTAYSSSDHFALSAAPSRDRDVEPSADQGLNFSWTCTYRTGGVVNVCRNVTGVALYFAQQQDITVKAGLLPPAPFPYIFTVTVMKPGRKLSSYSKSVFVKEGAVPNVAMHTSGVPMKNGALYVTSKSRLILNSLSDKQTCRAPSITYPPGYVFNASNTTTKSNGTQSSIPALKPIIDPGITENCISAFNWTFDPPLNTKAVDVPFGYHQDTFVLNSAPHILLTGTTYNVKLSAGLVEVSAGLVGGAAGFSTLKLVVNTPPVSGTFTACLSRPGQKGCIKSGVPITDEFRISCSGWVDVDLPLEYKFGYSKTTVSGNDTETETVWYDKTFDDARDVGFPVGSVQLLAIVNDVYGAETDLQTDVITISDQGPGGRRLLSSGGFWAKAKAKLKESLQTFRADKINQMAGAMSGSSGGMSAADQQSMKGNLLATMASGTLRSTPTTGGQCESFSAAKAVTSNAASLGGAAVGGMAAMMKNMLKAKLAAKMDMNCAANAAGSMGSSLKAQAEFKKANPGQSMMTSVSRVEFVQSLESGMKQVMRQAVFDAVTGEGPRQVSLDTAEHSVNRVSASQMKTGSTYESWSHPIPSMFGSGSTRRAGPRGIAAIKLPDTFTTDLFGSQTPDLDVHTQAHGFAPDAPGFKLKSPLVGLTVSYAKAESAIPVRNLSKPILITIPVDTSDLNPKQRVIFSQQVKCVFWDNTTYQDYGCNVSEASIFSVTCKCTHLTLFAIHHDTSARACGDGVIQVGEQCDDVNAINRDGCSSSCQVEPDCECTGEPSFCKCKRKSGGAQPAIAGIKASLKITGYSSKQDFLNGQTVFTQSVATAMGIPGMTANDIVILKVCFGSDCEEFFTIRRSEMQLRAADGQLEVFFFVNKGDPATTAELYMAITKPTFLSSFTNSMLAATGREIRAQFGMFPAVVEDGASFNKPGFGPNAGGSGNSTGANLFKSASDPIPGLAGWVVYLIVALSSVALIVFACVSFIIPMYKTFVKARKIAKFRDDNRPKKQQKVHKAVAEELKAQDKWKSEVQEEEEEDLSFMMFDARDSEGEKDDDDELETEILPDVKPVTGSLDPYGISPMPDDGERPAAALWPGATSLTSASGDQNATGRWGHARSRLKALEMQLDQLLEKLPRGEEEESEAAVANQLMAEAGAPRQRASYARPTLPDLSPAAPLGATAESQPIRRVRRGPGPQAMEPASTSSRPITTVRRAPKLAAMIDDLDIAGTELGVGDTSASGSPDKKVAWQ